MTEKELKKLMEKFEKLAKDTANTADSRSIVCNIDLGVVVLEVQMGLN